MKRLSIANRSRTIWLLLVGILVLPGCITVSSPDRVEVSDFVFCVNKMQEGGKASDDAAMFCAEQVGASDRRQAKPVSSTR